MTIGTGTSVAGFTFYGYYRFGGVGSLSPNNFTHAGSTITVNTISYNVFTDKDPILQFSTSAALPSGDAFVLQVGSHLFGFAGGGELTNSFLNPGVDWSMSVGQTVTARLRELPLPPAPTNLTATPGDEQVTLAWDAPPSGAVISRHEYRYKWKTGDSDYTPWKVIPGSAAGGHNASSYTATKHVNLIDYVFQVRAVNAGGESDPSNEAAATPLHPDAPPAPTVSAPAGTAGLLEVSWTEPTAGAYVVRYWPADEDGSRSRTVQTVRQSILIWPLDANTEYKISVATAAIAVEGGAGVWRREGPWSAPATARTGAPQSGRPVLSLYVLDKGDEVSEGAITEGGRLYYRIKATNILNYHNWGEPGVLGHFRLRWEWAGDRHPPHPVTALLNDSGSEPPRPPSCQTTPLMRVGIVGFGGIAQPSFIQTSATKGYWEFKEPIPDYAAELGPVRLVLQNQHCGSPVSGPFLQAGSRNLACVTIADNGSGPAYDGSDPTTPDERPTYSCAGQQRSSSSLKGRFVSAPERHDGTKRIKVRVAFSEAPENVGEHGVEVEGGEVTSVSAVGGNAPDGAGTRSVGGGNAGREDREVVWEFEIEPDSDGDVTVSIEAGRPCDEQGAICTADGRSLSEGISTTVEGPDEGPPPLTASFEGIPETHDGQSAFRFRVAFSEPIAISFRSLREDAFQVAGGRVTRGTRVDRRKDLFRITVEPDGAGEVAISLPAGRECSVSGAICTWGPPRKQLTNTPAATVAGPAAAPLTASFEDVPAEHDGENSFTLRIAFSEPLSWMNGRRLREDVVAVAGGRATSAGRVNRRRDLWKLTVEPDSLADVTVTLAAGAACDTPAAVCTSDGRALSNTISATVWGPVAVSVADARAREGEDETIDFAVSLSRAASATVAVSYATADGSATAGEDYTRSGGMLRFAPGETAKTVSVPVLDDAVDEGAETLTLRLLNASGAVIADGVATGTIQNSDPLPAAWLARFGRTAAGQVLAAVGERLRGGGQTQATVAGQRLQAADAEAVAAAQAGYERAWAERLQEGRLQERPRALAVRDLVAGSSFSVTAASAEPGGRWTVWGRGAWSRFAGSADGGALQVDGDVVSATAGADYEQGAVLAGLALAYSSGSGAYDHDSERSGTVASTLLSVHPYARLALHERLAVWGLFGYGLVGDVTLDDANAGAMETGTGMLLGAFGVDGLLLAAAQSGGLELAARADGLLLRMSSEAATGLAASEADLSRWRLLLEATYAGLPLLGGELRPAVAVGGRYDAGAAETGAGLVLSGRVSYALPAWGLTLSAGGEGLLVHEEEGFREWGAGGSLRFDPGAPGRGLALKVEPTWGVAGSGAGRLWALPDAATLAPAAAQPSPGARLAAELSYGLDAPGAAGALTPYAGVTLAADGGRVVRVGGRMGLDSGLAVSLEGTRAEPVSATARHTLALAATLSW